LSARALCAAVAVLALGAGCDDESDVAVDTLVFTRDDGSTLEIDGPLGIECGALNPESPPTLRVTVGERKQPHWVVEATLEDLKRTSTFAFPGDDAAGYPVVFVFDAARRANELSSSVEEARGWLRFRKADCETGVDFQIRAHLGSEYSDLPGVDVRGRFATR
jgi:hypothetical protein